MQTAEAIVLVDARPIVVGHVLVAPKTHSPTMSDEDAATQTAVADTARVAMRVLEQEFGSAGCYEHGGPVLCRPHLGKVSSPHAHLHVLPFSADLIGDLEQLRVEVDEDPEEYLSQILGSDGEQTCISLATSMISKHLVRTHATRWCNDHHMDWNPLAAPTTIHDAAAADTRDLFMRASRGPSSATEIEWLNQ